GSKARTRRVHDTRRSSPCRSVRSGVARGCAGSGSAAAAHRRRPDLRPDAAPGAVDMVVTQHPVEDEAPEMMLRVDGEAVPVVTRLHSKRSVVATVSLAEFDRIASAGSVVERAFDAELEFGPGQVRMLRTTADRWLGRVR